jgi:hypothetical protein
MRPILELSNTGIMGSNPAKWMNVCPHFKALYCNVQVYLSCQVDTASKDSY